VIKEKNGVLISFSIAVLWCIGCYLWHWLEDPKNTFCIAFGFDAAVVFHTLQSLCYALMAIIIMRLKLFWTPQLCVMAGLLASPRVI